MFLRDRSDKMAPSQGGMHTSAVSSQSGKPVGVALVSFKATPPTEAQVLGSVSSTTGGASSSTMVMIKPRELNLATHPFPHLAAAAAAATAKSSAHGLCRTGFYLVLLTDRVLPSFTHLTKLEIDGVIFRFYQV